MELMKATETDLEELLALYQRAADQMKAEGLEQWHWGIYPSERMIRDDVEKGLMYIQRVDGALAGAVALFDGTGEPEYDAVSWTGGLNPIYFHRLVIDPPMQGAGMAGGMLDDLLQMVRREGYDCIRCDTAINNKRAMRLYEKMGFRPCGYIQWDNSGEKNIALNKPLKRETPLWPIRMTPAFRGGSLTPWGGDKLKTRFGKEILETPTGESLEVSCIPGLESRDVMGRTLPELISYHGEKLVGKKYADRPFPLLLKLIDARESLSVQVHPGDAYAAKNEGGKLGKTEAWLILDTPEGGGELVYGIKAGTSMNELKAACEAGKAVEPLLHRVKVRPGDVYFIPSGCVHAIGAGIVLYEIQQSSDLTYRFYDWDRTDAQGNRRELHLQKALDVTNLKLNRRPVHVERAFGIKRVLNEDYFTLDIIQPDGTICLPEIQHFGMITALEGNLTLRWASGSMKMKTGETFFLPASVPPITMKGTGMAALSMPC